MAKPKTEGKRPVASPAGFQWRVPALVLILSLVAPLLSVVPTLEGAFRDIPPGQEYLGFRWMIGDHVQYGSFARQGEAGRLLMDNMFTTEAQRPSYILLYFNVVGLTMRFTGMSFPVAWEVLRVLFGFGMLVAAWYFLCLVFRERGQRLLAWVLVAFSGGVYYLTSLLPEDALTRPGFGFLTDPGHFQWNWSTFSTMMVALWIPPIMLILAAGILLLYDRPLPGPVRWGAMFAMGPLIWFVHPHSGNVAYFAFGLFGLAPAVEALWNLKPIPWRKTIDSMARVMPFILSFGLVVAYLSWASQDAVFAAGGRGAAQWNPAYSVFWYPLVYGLLLPLAFFGIRWSGSLREGPRHLLLGWLAAALILSVNPLFSGVKYQFLIHLPLAILAAHGIIELKERSAWVRQAARGTTGILVGALLLLHGPVSLLRDMKEPVQEARAYVPSVEVRAMEWLDGQPPGTVLCGYRACGDIAYLSGKKVYTGHWLLTLNQQQKHRDLATFFSNGVGTARKRQFLATHRIRYVYMGPYERQLGTVDPALGLEPIYAQDGVSIYRVP